MSGEKYGQGFYDYGSTTRNGVVALFAELPTYKLRLYVSLKQINIGIYSGFRMLSESSFIESSIFYLESGFSIVESRYLKRESEHESGFFPSPGFLRVRVRVRSGFRSMPSEKPTASLIVVKATVLKGLKTILLVVVVTSKHGDIRCCFVSS